MTNHEPSKGAKAATDEIVDVLQPYDGGSYTQSAIESDKLYVARIIDRHMQTEREIPAGCSRAFAIKTPTGYECRFRDMILYAYPIYDVEEQSAKLAEQWCADFNSRLALTLRESVKELVAAARGIVNLLPESLAEMEDDYNALMCRGSVNRFEAALKPFEE